MVGRRPRLSLIHIYMDDGLSPLWVGEEVAPRSVHDLLAQHVLADGYKLVVDLERSHGCRPVSYTHLDVYKRQPYVRPEVCVNRFHICIGARWGSSMGASRFPPAQTIVSPNDGMTELTGS